MADLQQQRESLASAIAGLEAQRTILGDAVVDPAVAALRQQLDRLESGESAPQDERKLVTILFADISGFTALSETLDPEEVRNLINACFDSLVPVVQKYEGTIDKFIGDEIMALFGAPLAHEDDAERALRCALEMMEAISSFNERHRTALGLHLGINTGLVVTGNIGGRDRSDYSVMGDAVNLAARLEDSSDVGEIFVGPITHRLTERLFDFEAMPPMPLKGKENPVQVHRLVRAKASPTRVRGIEGLHGEIIGRENEMAIIRDTLVELAKGNGAALVILGDAGLGKSRLIAEARRASGVGGRWIEVRALPYTSGMSYWVARQLVLALLGSPEEENAVRQELASLNSASAPYLARLLDLPLSSEEEELLRPLSGEVLQARMHEAVQQLVRRAADEQPLVLIWEDLHWCDPSSRQVYESLLPLVSEMRLLLLAATRPEENARNLDHGRLIHLMPLSRAQSDLLVHQLLQIENLPPRLHSQILDRAEGNPFFLEELLRSFIDAGLITLRDGRAVAVQEIETAEIPATVQGVLAARIDRLDLPDKQALQHASVIGRIFQESILGRLTPELTRNRLEAALGELRQREFIQTREEKPAEFQGREEAAHAFKHAITHEVAYGSLLLARRRELHRRTGEALEELFPERKGELSATLGFHFNIAEESERAVLYLQRAAENARSHFANAEAIAYYRDAIRHAQRLLSKEDPSSRRGNLLHLIEGLGDVLQLIGDHEEARSTFESALPYAENAIVEARLRRKISLCRSLRREFALAGEALDAADRCLGEPAQDRGTAWWAEKLEIQLERMHLLYWQQMAVEMRAHAERYGELMREHGTSTQRSRFLRMRGLSRLVADNFLPSSQAAELARAAVDTTDDSVPIGEAAASEFVLGLIQVWGENFAETVHWAGSAFEKAERIGDMVLQARSLNYLALAYRRLGELAKTRIFAERTLDLVRKLGMTEYIAMATANLGWIAWKEGRAADCIARGREALDLWHGMDNPLIFDWIALWPMIAVMSERGNTTEAVALMEGLVAKGQQTLPDELATICRNALGANGDRERAVQETLEMAKRMHYL